MIIEQDAENGKNDIIPDLSKGSSAGQTLKKIFRQKDGSDRIEEQTASVSMLMKPLRLSMFIHLCQNPCDHTRSIARSFGKSVSAAKWNLEQLAAAGYIDSSEMNGRRIYWPSGMIDPGDILTISIAREYWPKKILKAIHAAQGGARQRNLTARTKASQQLVDYWLGKMVSAGILVKKDENGLPIYYLAPHFIGMIEGYNARAKSFSAALATLIRNDGLMPRNVKLRGSRLSIDVRLPTGRKRIHLECNPLSFAKKYAVTM